MANFHTHVGFSTVLGCGYAGAGIAAGAPIDAAFVAGGLCGLSGMLPDIDSDRGIPLRETMSLIAAIVPLLLVDRMQQLNLSYNSMVLAGGSIYFFVRFGLARLLARYTVHRGMFHSIPAALVFSGAAFLICGCSNLSLRYYNAGAVFFGVMSHLFLDEIYSIEFTRGKTRLKKSFGTALKIWGPSLWGNVSVYAKLAVVVVLILGEPSVMEKYGHQHPINAIAEKIRRHTDDGADGEPLDDSTSGDATSESPGARQPDRNIYDTWKRIWRQVRSSESSTRR